MPLYTFIFFLNIIGDFKKMKKIVTKNIWIVFILIALLWPLLILNKGIDFTDVGFYLANYTHILKAPDKYGIGTYMSNYIGGLLYSVFPSHNLMLLKFMRLFVDGISMILAFLVLKEYFNKNALSFFLMIASFALSRFPQCLSYNTFSVLFLSLCVFLLHKWINSKKGYLAVLLGATVGLSVSFRLPNLLFAVLGFVVLWVDITEERKCIIKDILRMTLGGLLGIGTGTAFVVRSVGFSGLIKGMNRYVDLGTDTDNSHGIMNMFKTVKNQMFSGVAKHIFYIAVAGIFLLILIYLIQKQRSSGKKAYEKYTAVVVGLIYVTATFLSAFKTHNIDTSVVMTALITIPVSLFSVFYYRKKDTKLSAISAVILCICVVIPFGTDNGIFQNTIVFFWTLPYTVIVFYNIIKDYCLKGKATILNSAVLSLCIVILVNISAINIYNNITLACTSQYRESSYNETKYIPSDKCLAGVHTTKKKAFFLDGISEFMSKEEFNDKKVLAINNIPLVFALIDNENLLGTSFWADLSSVSFNKLKLSLENAKESNDLPVVIIYNLSIYDTPIEKDSERTEYVKKFCESMNYKVADEGILDGQLIYSILEP